MTKKSYHSFGSSGFGIDFFTCVDRDCCKGLGDAAEKSEVDYVYGKEFASKMEYGKTIEKNVFEITEHIIGTSLLLS